MHLGTPAGPGRIGTPYHSPSAEGHIVHTVVGHCLEHRPAPNAPVASRPATSAAVAHTITVSWARSPPYHRPSLGPRRGADQLRGVRIRGLH